ncbi:molybdopterin-dependent oxidoreductase [Desulfococcaceae bacterium HSG9]|nr:molybdopterin-dependent oxidoreductase [Desulfococcaceae bacterium HSG9]
MTLKKDANLSGISRRKFLELAGVAGLGCVLAPSMLTTKSWAASGEVNGFNSSWQGLIRTKSIDGRLVSTTPWEGTVHKNAIADSMPEYVYSPARIKYPMVRKSYLEGGPGTNSEARGSEGFVRVSWDKATELIAKEIKRVIKEHGNASIMTSLDSAYLYSGRVNYAGSCMSRLANLMGGFTNTTGDYSTGAAQMLMPYVTGSIEVYAQATSYPTIEKNAEVLVFWGCNPVTTLRACWAANVGYGFDWLKKLKESGKKVIVIDPRRSPTAKHFGADWIAPAPNTDVAMMLGMAYTLHEKGLVDQKFLDEYTTGYDKFLPYLLGKTDKTPKTPEWAESICQIKAATIRELAQLVAEKPSMIFLGWSMQRADHGEQPPWMLVTLAAMIGQIGLPGRGYSMASNYGDNGSPLGTAPDPGWLDAGKAPKNAPPLLPAARTTDAILNPGKVIDFKGEKLTYPDIKMIFNEFGNPQCRHQERSKMIKAWKKPDTIVTNEIFWTASAWMADIVLPISSLAETDDVDIDSVKTLIAPIKSAIKPLYESKPSFEAFSAIAEALGIGKEFKYNEPFKLVEISYNAARKAAKDSGTDMPEFKEFWDKAEPIRFPTDKKNQDFVIHGEFREDPLLEPLGTASGKLEIYSKDIEKMGYADCGPHPQWYEPFEWLSSPIAKKYPLHLLTSRPKHRMHSQYSQMKSLRKLYCVADREPVTINAEDAKARGIKNGDVVRVFNNIGQTLAGAVVSEDIRPGVVNICDGGWYDPLERGKPGSLCKHGHANALLKDKPTSSFAQACNGNTALVEVEKYTGKIPKITAFDPPKGA